MTLQQWQGPATHRAGRAGFSPLNARPGRPRRRRVRPQLAGWLWMAPALTAYGLFVLYPLSQTVRYSLYDWDGVGSAVFIGLDNYAAVFSEPELYSAIVHAFELIVFFSFVPTVTGLVLAAILRELSTGAGATLVRTLLFLPQAIPLAAAAIAWTWLYANNGLINQVLREVGLGRLARPWLAEFDTALPAVGVIGSWLAVGFATVLFLAGIGKTDPSLYEAARLDGAGRVREFLAVTLPALRQEIVVCVTVTVIWALASFDIIYVSTRGGPGYQTMVPGVAIVLQAFTAHEVGLASALAVVLLVMVLCVALPLQRLGRPE